MLVLLPSDAVKAKVLHQSGDKLHVNLKGLGERQEPVQQDPFAPPTC